jgi:asparagine synthase (glutamine-hydrolysing)
VFGGYWWMKSKEPFETFTWSNLEAREWFLKEIPLKDYVQNHFEKTYLDNHQLTLDWFMPVLVDRTEKIAKYTEKVPLMPYKDNDLTTYSYNLNHELKKNKYILRKAAENILPEEIVYRKKFPYPKTYNETYLERVTEMLEEVINQNDEPINEFLDKNKIKNFLMTKSEEESPWFGQLMAKPQQIAYLLQVNYWLKKEK